MKSFFLLLLPVVGLARPTTPPEQVNIVPHMPLIDWSPPKVVRRLAVAPGPGNLSATAKELYFSVLLAQKQIFEGLLGRPPSSPSSCPQFHSALLAGRPSALGGPSQGPLKVNVSLPMIQGKNAPYFPELFLPLSLNKRSPIVANQLQGTQKLPELIVQGLSLHVKKAQREIQELCEHGSGHNLFAAHGLLDSPRPLPKNLQGVATLLKTSLFVNHLLIVAMGPKALPGHYTQLMEEVYQRMAQGPWKDYFHTLKNRRVQRVKDLSTSAFLKQDQ